MPEGRAQGGGGGGVPLPCPAGFEGCRHAVSWLGCVSVPLRTVAFAADDYEVVYVVFAPE